MKILIRVIIPAFILIFNTSCSLLFVPKKQKITFNTSNEESTVYVNNEEVGKGKQFTAKITRNGTSQVIVKTPKHADEYYVLAPKKTDPLVYPMVALDIPFGWWYLAIGWGGDHWLKYDKEPSFLSNTPYFYKKTNEKFIELSTIGININDSKKDIRSYSFKYNPNNNTENEMKLAEQKQLMEEKKAEIKAAKKKKKKKRNLLDEKTDTKISYRDSKFSSQLYDILYETKYIDTTESIFKDNNNTLYIEGSIKKVGNYTVYDQKMSNYFSWHKSKIDVLWYVKNSYGEVIDSINIESISGEFKKPGYYSKAEAYNRYYDRLYSSAVMNSYHEFVKTDAYKNNINVETSIKILDEELIITKPSEVSLIKEVGDAIQASVIIKRKDKGHGSGFAISNDGYIITNFHVIAGKLFDQPEEVSVILSNGIEIPAKVIRYNRATDVALLKVDYTFEKAFLLKPSKEYKNYMEVYASGAPKSIELGQTVTLGLLSNERNFNDLKLLQLSMSINGGNSGGPLFDKQGNLHGVIQSKLVGYATEGVGFAIPSYIISEYLNISIK